MPNKKKKRSNNKNNKSKGGNGNNKSNTTNNAKPTPRKATISVMGTTTTTTKNTVNNNNNTLSMSSSIINPSNLSPLLFSNSNTRSVGTTDNGNGNGNGKSSIKNNGIVDIANSPHNHYVSPKICISDTNVKQGRGVVALDDITVGECLFVTPPTVSVNVEQVYDMYNNDENHRSNPKNSNKSIEQISELILLQNMKNYMQKAKEESNGNNHDDNSRHTHHQAIGIVNSFLALTTGSKVQSDMSSNSVNRKNKNENGNVQNDNKNTSDVVENNNGNGNIHSQEQQQLLKQLLGFDQTEVQEQRQSIVPKKNNDDDTDDVNDDDLLLRIIRHNAFGPDFITYQVMERKWKEEQQKQNSNNNNNNGSSLSVSAASLSTFRPNRILGIYPLAAMINHSCQPNALRVYTKMTSSKSTTSATSTSSTTNQQQEETELMLVHAACNISKGEEIVWSYLPSTTPFPVRQSILQQQHGFTCQCIRCIHEGPIWGESTIPSSSSSTSVSSPPKEFLKNLESLVQIQQQRSNNNNNNHDDEKESDDNDNDNTNYVAVIDDILEKQILQYGKNEGTSSSSSTFTLSNTLRHYLRIGFIPLYMKYLNEVLQKQQEQSSTSLSSDISAKSYLLNQICTPLHFAFCVVDNGSTEHLSILHLCYELIGQIHTAGLNNPNNNGNSSTSTSTSKTLPKLKFWTEQIKRACMARYGPLGKNIESVRTVMQHTKQVLRNRDGIEYAKYDFI